MNTKKPWAVKPCIDCGVSVAIYHALQTRCKKCRTRFRNSRKKTYHQDCGTCGQSYRPRSNRSRLCPECLESLTCGVCEKTVKRTGFGQKYCSQRCRDIIKTSVKRGPNHLKALQRDALTCQKCGKDDVVIHVHHIDGFGTGHPDAEQNNSLSNLIVLCNPCHTQAHRLITRRLWEAHTAEVLDQFAEFMS